MFNSVFWIQFLKNLGIVLSILFITIAVLGIFVGILIFVQWLPTPYNGIFLLSGVVLFVAFALTKEEEMGGIL